MWSMLWPLGLIILSNTLYNICTKSTPAGANAFLSLFVAYVISATMAIGMFFLGGNGGTFFSQLKQLNWTTPVLAMTLIGLEFGYICVYRAGWKVSTCSLTGNICLACVLLFVGLLLYRETISLRQLIGMAVCAVGLFLING